MSLIIGGVEVNDVVCNGVSLDKVICNGVTVWERETFELVDFEYVANGDGTYTITDWKGTYNGEASTRCIIPDDERIIL